MGKHNRKMLSNFSDINVDVCILWDDHSEPIVKFHRALHEVMADTDLVFGEDAELIAWAEQAG